MWGYANRLTIKYNAQDTENYFFKNSLIASLKKASK